MEKRWEFREYLVMTFIDIAKACYKSTTTIGWDSQIKNKIGCAEVKLIKKAL